MAPDFWNNNQKASLILKQIARLEKEINLWTDMERRHGDVEILFEFAEEGEASLDEIKTDLSSYQKIVDDIELKMILGKKEDAQNAIITIHPGAGGTESQDWAEMLYRMYSRWVEQKEFKMEVLDLQPGDEAGLKDVTFEVKGDFA
ncbi:MAG: PCRF domain-containing protein, partial [Candidatus Marinimicrobia bacterium]|nr:PCRF domain-containing protein [Candidatus Neomarinimicrobiota bacterium]MBT6159673.1 PCRF domain-containing protein [Candidatus Neomarinimicrobiota bacterium]